MKKILLGLAAILGIGVVVFFMRGGFGEKPEIVEDSTPVEKQEFFVQTSDYNDLKNNAIIQKAGKINSSQDINLTANASGRVSYISVKPGQQVFVGQVLAQLEDNIGNYGINISKASNGVERSKINYDSTKISLDKAVFDAELNLEQLERGLETFIKDSKQTLLQAQDNLNNSQYGDLDSASALRLQQLDNNIEKAKLDYDIKLSSDQQTINTYGNNLVQQYNGLTIILDDIIEFTDQLLGVTDGNKRENDDFDQYLGIKDSTQKNETKQLLRDIINYRDNQDFLDINTALQSGNLSEEQIIEIINQIDDGYNQSIALLNNIEVTLNNSIVSAGSFSSTDISGYRSTINGYQSQAQGNYGSFIGFSSTARTFISTYRNSQASALKSIELQEQDRDIQFKNLSSSELNAETSYEKTLLSIDDNKKNLEDQIKSAKNNLSNAIQNRAVTLRSLNNSIKEAQINYTSSSKEYNKLTISSPINGTIGDVLIDQGQEVFQGNPLFEIVSNNKPEVEISFSASERSLIKQGQKVYIDLGRERITGTIYSISEVADENLNYKSTITFSGNANLIGNLVTVDVPIETETMLIPINIITTQGDEIGLVKTLSGSTFADVRMRMGEVFGEYVEIVSCAKNCEELNIITNDVTNFDENKFIIVEK